MKKYRLFFIFVILSFVFFITGCSSNTESVKQSATAKQVYGEDQTAIMTVDLTDGYSVEFSSGAAYFYKGDSIDDSEVLAHAFVISIADYDEEISYFQDNDDLEGEFKDLEDGFYSYKTEESIEYFFPTNDDLYLKVVVGKEALDDADSIYTRFSAMAEE